MHWREQDRAALATRLALNCAPRALVRGFELVSHRAPPSNASGGLRSKTSAVEAPLKVRARTPLFRVPFIQSAHANYDVLRDGTRFVLARSNMRAKQSVVAPNAMHQLSVNKHKPS